MIKCIKCKSQMVENVKLRAEGFLDEHSADLKIKKGTWPYRKLSDINCTVCPECGYIELYADNTEAIKEHKQQTIN